MKVKKILKTIVNWAILGTVAIAQFIPWIAIGMTVSENVELTKKVNK